MRRLPILVLLGSVLLASPTTLLANETAESLARAGFTLMTEHGFSMPDVEKAKEMITRAHAMDPEEPWVNMALAAGTLTVGYIKGSPYALSSYTKGSVEQAEAYSDAAGGMVQSIPALIVKAQIQMIQSRWSVAESYLGFAELVDEENPAIWANMAQLYALQHRVDEAREALAKAEQFDTRQVYRVSIIQQRMSLDNPNNDPVLTEKYFKTLIELQPTSPHAYGNYGVFLLKQNRPAEAITYLEKALSLGRYRMAEEQLALARERLKKPGKQ